MLSFKVPFLPGESDLDQLSRIFQVLGTPTEKDWPVSSLQDLNKEGEGQNITAFIIVN